MSLRQRLSNCSRYFRLFAKSCKKTASITLALKSMNKDYLALAMAVVERTSPSAGSKSQKGDAVTVYYSKANDSKAPLVKVVRVIKTEVGTGRLASRTKPLLFNIYLPFQIVFLSNKRRSCSVTDLS